MKQGFIAALVIAVMGISFPAFALDLHQARAAGIVGEKLDGYVAVLKESAEAAALIKDVNQKRRQEYERISEQNQQPVEVVAKLAAEQIINRLDPGAFYQGADGVWKKR